MFSCEKKEKNKPYFNIYKNKLKIEQLKLNICNFTSCKWRENVQILKHLSQK